MGGSNKKWNIVRLTAEEHFVAHELLVKIYPENLHLASALIKMAHRCNGNKIYGWIRRRHAAAASKYMKGNKWWLGKKHTAEWKAARAAEMLGKKMPRDGVEKMAATKRGKTISQAHRAAISSANTGRKFTAEHREKIAVARIGIPCSEAAKLAVAKANRERIYTPEMRAKMSASHKGRPRAPHTQETRDKISAAHKSRFAIAQATRDKQAAIESPATPSLDH